MFVLSKQKTIPQGMESIENLFPSKWFLLIYKEIQRDRVKSHIWLTASSYMVKNLRISSYIGKPYTSYMTLHPIQSEFSDIWWKFSFLSYLCCSVRSRPVKTRLVRSSARCGPYKGRIAIHLWEGGDRAVWDRPWGGWGGGGVTRQHVYRRVYWIITRRPAPPPPPPPRGGGG